MNQDERKEKQYELAKKMVEYLPVLRAAAQLTQNQLAKMLGITRASMIHFETQKRQLPFHMYLALVLIFHQNEDAKKLLESFELFDAELLNCFL